MMHVYLSTDKHTFESKSGQLSGRGGFSLMESFVSAIYVSCGYVILLSNLEYLYIYLYLYNIQSAIYMSVASITCGTFFTVVQWRTFTIPSIE